MDSRTFDEVHVGSPSLLDKSCLSGSSICNDPTVLLGRYPTGRHFPALFCYLQTTSVQKWTIPSGESDFRNPPPLLHFLHAREPKPELTWNMQQKYRSFEPSFPDVFHSWRLVNESNPASIDVLTCFEAVETDSRRLIRMSSLPMVYPATSAIICIPNQMFCQICGSQP